MNASIVVHANPNVRTMLFMKAAQNGSLRMVQVCAVLSHLLQEILLTPTSRKRL
jgi:hypothetical protein